MNDLSESSRYWRRWLGRTSLFDDIQTGVSNVVVFNGIFVWLGEGADEDWVILRGYERDSVQPECGRHDGSSQPASTHISSMC